MKTTTITIRTRSIGQNFATCAQLVSARTGRVLAETGERPYGFDAAAIQDAETLAEPRGYRVARDED